jgi:uncharacterized protein YkuJ
MMSPHFAFKETETLHDEVTLIAIEIYERYFFLE